MSKDSEGKLTCQPIFSRIVSLFAEQNDLMFAVPGGLIGVGTKVWMALAFFLSAPSLYSGHVSTSLLLDLLKVETFLSCIKEIG